MHKTILFLIAASCVAAIPVAENPVDLRYICFSETNCGWMTLEQALLYRETHEKDCGDFVDFTDARSLEHPPAVRKMSSFPKPSHQNLVKPLIDSLSADNLKASVAKLSGYLNRYYTSQTGVQSMEWVKSQFDAMPNVKAEYFHHPKFIQPSVIATITGTESPEQIVILGAHGDSIAGRGGAQTKAPGADDDASGVANLIEAARVISQASSLPKKTIQFMAYAAEEVGLLGSLDIAKNYSAAGADVFAVYQIEMSGYAGKSSAPAVTLISDYVDPELLAFTRSLIKEYLTYAIKEVKCSYGCSDHYSFYNAGYPDVCAAEAGPFDSALNPNMHTANDAVGILDFDHCKEFAKLAVAFAVELAY